MADVIDSPAKPLFDHDGRLVVKVTNDAVNLSVAEKSFTLTRKLPTNCHLTDEAESMARISTYSQDGTALIGEPKKELVKTSESDPENVNIKIDLDNPAAGDKVQVAVELLLFYCSEADKTCKRDCVLITQPVEIVGDS